MILVRTGTGALWEDPRGVPRRRRDRRERVALVRRAASRWRSAPTTSRGTCRARSIPELGSLPGHLILLVREGIYIIEALNLEELARDGVREFAFACLPLKLRGGTGLAGAADRARVASPMATHYFPEDQVHFTWDAGNEPVITIADGDTVVINTRDVSDNQIGPDSDASVIDGLNWDRVYPLAGPIAVEGAAPGDTLVVEILDLRTRGWGWTAILPGLGLLADDFPDAYLKIFDISAGDYARFGDEAAIPLTPFMGTMGVCPADASAQPIMPPGPLRREHGHAPARGGDDAVPAGAGRRRAVLHRRRARLPGRRRGLRDRARGADVRVAALLGPEGARAAGAAVPHGARLADLAGRPRRRGTAPPASGPTCSSTPRTRCGR